MIRRPPRSTLDRSSAASDVYKRQGLFDNRTIRPVIIGLLTFFLNNSPLCFNTHTVNTTVSYTHLRAHETVLDLVCRLLLEKKKNKEK